MKVDLNGDDVLALRYPKLAKKLAKLLDKLNKSATVGTVTAYYLVVDRDLEPKNDKLVFAIEAETSKYVKTLFKTKNVEKVFHVLKAMVLASESSSA